MGAEVINKNMCLHECDRVHECDEQISMSGESSMKSNKHCLLIMLAWLTSTDRYLDKYRTFYLSRGFDVLTIRTHVPEILFPTKGSQVIAKNLMLYLTINSNKYSNIVVHGFSVGAYQFSEFLVLLEAAMQTPERVTCEMIKSKIRGVIFDSAVSARAAPHGVAVSAVGENPACRIFEWFIVLFMKVMHSVTTKHYINAENVFANTPLRCPAVLFCSSRDRIGDEESNRRILHSWIRLGIPVVWKCWESSKHVAHLQTYPREYTEIVTNFLDALDYEK